MADKEKYPLRIVILDDDNYPKGRISKYVLPEFSKRGLDKLVVHFTNFEEYIKYIDDPENIAKIGLIVMDSSLDSGKHYVGIEQTLPYTLKTLENENRRDLIKCIIPASGGIEGIKNNQYTEELLARYGYHMDSEQCTLFAGGLSADPKVVCDRICRFYDHKYPGILSNEIKQEIKTEILEVATPQDPESVMGPTEKKESQLYARMAHQLYEKSIRT